MAETAQSGLDVIRQTFAAKMAKGLPTEALVAMLEGEGWPAMGTGDDPYIHFLTAVEDSPQDKHRLAQRLATALDEEWDVKPKGRKPSRVLHGLLQLCGKIYDPEVLLARLRGFSTLLGGTIQVLATAASRLAFALVPPELRPPIMLEEC